MSYTSSGYYYGVNRKHRISEIRRDIVQFVRDYFVRWQKPVGLKIISQKWARTLAYYETRLKPELIELEKQGLIILDIDESGRQFISPGLTAWNDDGFKPSRW